MPMRQEIACETMNFVIVSYYVNHPNWRPLPENRSKVKIEIIFLSIRYALSVLWYESVFKVDPSIIIIIQLGLAN